MEAFYRPEVVIPKKSSLDDNATSVRERFVEELQHVQTTAAQIQRDFSSKTIGSNQFDVALLPEESDWNDEVRLDYIPGRTEEI
jgi:hypothetical protein